MAENDRNSLSGEVLTDETEGRLANAMEKVEKEGMITARLAAHISRSPFFNRLTKKRIESAHEVVRAENAFMGDLRTHQLTKDRLLNLDTDIATQRAQQLTELSAARNRLAAENAESELQNLANQIKREQFKAQLAALKRANEGVSEEKSQEQRYQEQLDAAAQKAAFEARMNVQRAREKIAARRALAVERDRMIADIKAGSDGSLSPEEEFEIENIRDLFQTLMDEV